MDGTQVVFLTALGLEYDAIRAKLTGVQVRTHHAGTRFEVGRLGDRGCLAALALAGKGNHPAAVLAERAIAEFAPKALLFVGVAGALQEHVALGDVVVATHVYAYHGGTSQDDGLKARPRAWETSHAADQIARHLERTGTWASQLHFGPIAAGEVVQYSTLSDEARWIREHYNDALAIEMEAAGVAQAGHLNNSLPVLVVRGISDRADAGKTGADAAGWQPRAVANAAAFAVALAEEVAFLPPGGNRTAPEGPGTTGGNIARDWATVGIQAGQINGPVHLFMGSGPVAGLRTEIADLRRQLERARQAGRIDEPTHEAAQAELDIAEKELETESRSKLVIALRRLHGLISEMADLGAKVAAIISAARGMP
jgi:adenosylhomocysteine nucleosidase